MPSGHPENYTSLTDVTACPARRQMTNTYDLTGLVQKLKALEPDFRQVEEEVKAERKAVAKRGYKARSKPSKTAI